MICCGIPTSTTPQNFSSIRPFKLRKWPDKCVNFRICFLRKNESDTNSSFLMNGILSILFEGIFFLGYCVVLKHVPTNFKSFLRRFSPSCHCQTGPTTLLHGCRAVPDRRFVESRSTSSDSSPRQANQEFGNPTKSSANRPRVRHHRPMDCTGLAHRNRRAVTSSSWHRPRHKF